MNQRDARRIANYCASQLIRVAQGQGFGVEQELIDSLGLSEADVQRIENEIDNIRMEILNRIGGGRKGRAIEGQAQGKVQDPPDQGPWPGDVTGKKYVVCPGWITTRLDGGRRFIDFETLADLYRVDPSECVEVPPDMQDQAEPPQLKNLIWLHPQDDGQRYADMREELARGEDAFKLD